MAGTPPLSCWLDFLLDSSLLEAHLLRPGCVPTACQLIVQFLQQANNQAASGAGNQKPEANSGGDQSTADSKGDRASSNKRIVALKILALKTAAYLGWNLDVLEESVPPLFLMALLLELVKQVNTKLDDAEDLLFPSDVSDKPDQIVFALQLYHRWATRTLVKDAMPTRPMKTLPVAVPGLTEPLVTHAVLDEERMNELRSKAQSSLDVLRACLLRGGPVLIMGPNCFVLPTEAEPQPTTHDYSKMSLLTERDYIAPLCFDMGCKLFLDSKYSDAVLMFEQCTKHTASGTKSAYASVDASKLGGYLAASRSIVGQKGQESLGAKLEVARASGDWLTVARLVVKDIVDAELPSSVVNALSHEASLRGCPAGELACLTFSCDLSAAIRSDPTLHLFNLEAVVDASDFATFVQQALEVVVKSGDTGGKRASAVRGYVRYLLSRCPHTSAVRKSVISSSWCAALFSESELIALQRPWQSDAVSRPDPTCSAGKGSVSLSTGSASISQTDAADEKQIFFTYDDVLIKKLMLKLQKHSPHFIKNVCESWKLSKDLARGFIQLSGFDASYCFVLTAKARECMRMQDFATARGLLGTAERLAKDISSKLSKLLRWEILYVDLVRYRRDLLASPEEQQPQQNIDLVNKVRSCLTALKTEAEIYPGDSLIQECVVFLLNAKDWEYISSKSNVPSIEFSRILGDACKEQLTLRGSRVATRALWDAVVQVYSDGPAYNRRDGAMQAKMPRLDEPNLPNKEKFREIIMTIQEPTALFLLLSLFARLFNVIKSDAAISLPSDVASVWPSSLDKIAVDTQGIQTAFEALLKHALIVHPQQPIWLKMQADLYFVDGNYNGSLRYYLEAGAVTTKFFSEPPARQIYDDQVYRRLIKCCMAFRCYTQAAVLCQFLDEIDHTMAFKCLQEKNSYDAADAYYGCIWDISILEFLANLHCKRGELEKKQLALNLIGQQELNGCNGEPILLKVATIRKMEFLTMLAQQYLNCHSENSLPPGALLT